MNNENLNQRKYKIKALLNKRKVRKRDLKKRYYY